MSEPPSDEPTAQATENDGAPGADPAPARGETPEPPSATHGAEDETWETGGDDTPHLEEEVVVLRRRVEELEAENQALKDKWMRARADYENLSRRTDAERERYILEASGRVVERLLEPLDVLERATAEAAGIQDAHAQGLRLTHKGLLQVLEREGLEPVPGVGTPFDVAFHEAIAREASELPEGTVAEVIRPGYRMKGRLLRPALVKVSAGPES